MKLHEDRGIFQFFVEKMAIKSGIRKDILEKDYYVSLLLEELSQKEKQGYAYFKGGTALYKALKSIRRFSEDIDLTVFVEDCPSPNQARKRLENASLFFTCLPIDLFPKKQKGSIECSYLYDSVFALDNEDELQRFGKVKVEATSFTVSEPTETITIAPQIYEIADEEEKKILTSMYEVKPFIIETISMQRIFIDKIFASQFYYERKAYGDLAKHLYDLTVLFPMSKMKIFLQAECDVRRIVSYKRKEEKVRKGGIAEDMKMKDFTFFGEIASDKDLQKSFEKMQKIYVFSDEDKIRYKTMLTVLEELKRTVERYDF